MLLEDVDDLGRYIVHFALPPCLKRHVGTMSCDALLLPGLAWKAIMPSHIRNRPFSLAERPGEQNPYLTPLHPPPAPPCDLARQRKSVLNGGLQASTSHCAEDMRHAPGPCKPLGGDQPWRPKPAPADARQLSTYRWLNRYPAGVDWHQRFAPAPLYQLFDGAVAKYALRPCTNFLGKVLSYGEIARSVDRAAAGLQKLGVKKGSKVGLFMPNCPTFIVYYFATLKAGGTIVNYNPLYT